MVLCSCYSCKPRYKRLVDNIFPSVPEEGLVRSEMEKLTYYALSAPEKLNRIGDYLARRLTHDISRRRDSSVFVAMEALNQLLLACHAQQINLFVESFLKMVATLLESDVPDFQALGTNSFVKFSKIEEDTASYHRRYDFFVSKFSSMCHCSHKDPSTRLNIQLHGVRGLRAVIRKTVSDELQVNIWEKQHMDKIVPSLLFSMQNNPDYKLTDDGSPVPHNEADEQHPAMLAEEAFRELLARATFANLSTAVTPVLSHLDGHRMWTPDNAFAVKSFKIIMYSVQGQYSHVVVKLLLDHLDHHNDGSEHIKASVLSVLCAVVPIPSSTSIGPSVIDVFNRLSHHLHHSSMGSNKQPVLESAVITTTGVLGSVIPDYQKLEAMSFYINKTVEAHMEHELSSTVAASQGSNFASLLLECIIQINNTYQNQNLSSLTSTFLDPLMKLSLILPSDDRLLTQRILISVLDKKKNSSKLEIVSTQDEIENLGLVSASVGKYDKDFINRQLPRLYNCLMQSFLLQDNRVENFINLYKCVSVLCLSIMSPDVIVDVTCLLIAAQDSVIEWVGTMLKMTDSAYSHVSSVLSATACCMFLVAYFSSVPDFQFYVNEVIGARKILCPDFLPIALLKDSTSERINILDKDLQSKVLFTCSTIYDALKGRSGFPVERLKQPFLSHTDIDSRSVAGRTLDVESINIEFHVEPLQCSSPQDGTLPASAITFNYLKQLFQKPPQTKLDQLHKQQKIADRIRAAEFEQLMAETPPDPADANREFLNKLFADYDNNTDNVEEVSFYDMEMPSICMY